MRPLLILAAASLLPPPAPAPPLPPAPAVPADLVLLRGTIETVDDRLGTVEALAVAGDRILAAGTIAQIEPHIGPATRVLDLEGKLAIPGFIEGHGHLRSLGESRMMLDLTRVANWDEVVSMVADAVAAGAAGDWIRGRGWHQEKWDRAPDGAVEGFPTHESLSAVSPDNPVLLTHASGHASFANRRAMDLAGVSGSTPDPPGGEILRDAGGLPTGLFRETAQGLIHAAPQGPDDPGHTERAVALAIRECLAKGVTSFQDAGSSFQTIDVLRRMAESGALEMRLWVMVREPNPVLAARLAEYAGLRDVGGHRLTVGGIKQMIDGALGSRGAWLLEPYTDSPASTGFATASTEEIAETARLALRHGLQLGVHAIGDRANRAVLDLYARIFAQHPDARDLRWRIEHAQHLHPDDIPRFARLGVVASVQAIHCTSDAPWVVARLGPERARRGAYAWRSLLDGGALVSNGTDAPVEDVDPIACFHAAVTRRLADGSVFFPEQRMTRLEALRASTIDAARAAREESIKGSLTPGKLADVVVLSHDILRVPEGEIREARVVLTIVGGQVVHHLDPAP